MILVLARFLIVLGWPFYKIIKLFILGVGSIVGLAGSLFVKTIPNWGNRFWASLSIVMLVVGFGVWQFWEKVVKTLPNIEAIYSPPPLSTKITDRDGRILYVFYQNEHRTWVPLNKIPDSLVKATIAIEDKEFFSHWGFSIKGMFRAFFTNFRKVEGENIQGGSTITQQLVKNVFLTKEKSWERKVKEIVLAIMLENKLSKEEILERYFNQVPYGGETYGAQEAAKRYFDKDVSDIDLSEATFLAGLPAAPTSYSPTEGGLNMAKKRQSRVLEEMVKAGFVDQQKALEVLNKPMVVGDEKISITYPHFVFYVREVLREKFGYQRLGLAGITVKTSINPIVQEMSEKVVAEEIMRVKRLRIGNGAAMVLDVKNGEVLAMVGSKDYNATDIDGKYNITTALRQPGSSIKPINYLNALLGGESLESIIDDAPVTYLVPGQKPYSPQNYNKKYIGKVTLRTALASSLNIPSVKLLDRYGVNSMIDLAEKMGITSWKDRSRFGLSLSLGAGEVSMLELAQAYSIFANLGTLVETNPVLEIRDYLNQTIYEKKVEGKVVFDPAYAYLINSALSDDSARAPVFGRGSKLVIPGKTVAVKTGTTNSLRDNWAIGWTPKYLVAAWVGNNDNSPMSWVASGISGATPIWNRITKEMIANDDGKGWEVPSGLTKARVCGRENWFIPGTETGIVCPPPPSPSPSVSPSPNP